MVRASGCSRMMVWATSSHDVRPGGESFPYGYNRRNRLSSVTRNGAGLCHVYLQRAGTAGLQQPAAIGGPVGTIHYLYDRDGHLIAEANGATGATFREYIWLPSNDNSNDTMAEEMGLVPRTTTQRICRSPSSKAPAESDPHRPPRPPDPHDQCGQSHGLVGQLGNPGANPRPSAAPHQQSALPRPILPDRNRAGLQPPPPLRPGHGPIHPAGPAELRRWTECLCLCRQLAVHEIRPRGEKVQWNSNRDPIEGAN